jgi:EAL domain-containing protein (putative c-di-GMP-specific phosphodiesterase class I)/CHASE2 domain-containing sensor protein
MLTRARSNWLIVAAMLTLGVLIAISPTGGALDRALGAARYGAIHRQASGQVVVVEMDARSAAAIKRWPWSRKNYAEVVDRLRRAGAASIVFDIDFSSSSDLAGDEAFAAALSRASGLVALPTFGQDAGSADRRTIDALPIASLRRHVALASVSIAPDADGQVRMMPLGTMTEGTPRPSLSAFIAQRSGAAGAEFPIDMSIDPATIPRLSFIDVRNGAFDEAAVRGRNVLIGATAVEMGDRYGTPNWGVIPGVIVQAMAAETLLRGVPQSSGPYLPLLLASFGIVLIVRARNSAGIMLRTCGAALAVTVVVLVAQHVLLTYYPLAAALGVVLLTGMVCTLRDAVDRFRTQRTTDETTGLPNLRVFESAASMGERDAVIVVLLDNYESVLAVLGSRLAADAILRIADRLALISQDNTVYRTSERQLTLRVAADSDLDGMLDGLRTILLRPVEVGGRRIDISLALGVSADMAAPLERRHADAAMAAEQAARDGVFWRYSDASEEQLVRSITLMGELDDALSANLIEVYYQPKFSLRQNRIGSVEALVRWPHPERGFIPPDVFVSLAERTNRIETLTLYVLRRVIRDLPVWRGANDVTAAINISAKLLSTATFNNQVEAILSAARVPADSLIFEVTESAAMSNPACAIAALRHYREMGIAVSMDDYGTGQSTLTYLRQLPLNELKIDRSFVQNAHLNRSDAVLVQSTITLAHELNLKVVAEGVEDVGCLEFLRVAGCDMIQGYIISPAVSLADLPSLIEKPAVFAA